MTTLGVLKNIYRGYRGSKYDFSIVFQYIPKVPSGESFKEFEKTSITWLFVFLKDIFWVLRCEYVIEFLMTYLGPLRMDI